SIITVVWFSVILNLTRDAFIEIANISLEHALLSWGVTLLMAIIFVIPAYKTIKWIAYVDYIAAPAIVFILIATVWGALDVGGGIRAIIEKADRKSTRLNSSHVKMSYAVYCWKQKTIVKYITIQ